jgi:predicted phosphodiesterase
MSLPFQSALALLTVSTLALPAAAAAEVRSAWVQMTGQGAEVRAVESGGICPAVAIDGKPAAMARRAAAGADFPMVCALPLPPGATSVSVEGRTLSAPRPARRIVIFGDTGCEVKALTAQACNDPRAWPFARIAALAAAHRPDLVIHVGDYYYRETPCPLQMKACAGSPSGDHWDTWAAEFFDPAAPLLRAAPWVFARGNHESCRRGWRGWYALLDAGPAPEACREVAAAFAVKTGDLNLYVIDSADADDRGHDPRQVKAVADQLDHLGEALDGGQGWIITHRPVWGLVPVARLGPAAPVEVGLNFTEQDAFRGRPMAGVQMVVSGHVHHFQAVTFGTSRPAQLVVGAGGDPGVKADRAAPYGGRRLIDGLDADTFSFSRFGFYLMENDGEDWSGTFHDIDDQVRARCRLHDRALSCQAVTAKTAPPAG